MEVVDTVVLEIPDSLSPYESLGAPNWKTLTSFVPLLKVLPALSVQRNEYVLNGIVRKESWNQLQSFAKFIEEFCLSDAEGNPLQLRVASLTYLRLAQFQGSLPLFPSLRRLQIVNATASLSHTFLLLSPSLEYLEISGFPPSHAHLVGSFLTTLSDEEGLSLKSLVLGPSPFDSESLRSIPCFKDLLSLKLNGAVSCWDSQLLESIGTLPKLLELVVDADDAEYHAVHSPPLPSDNIDDTKVDERSPVLGSLNSPPTQGYPDFLHHPPSYPFSNFGSESQPSPIPFSPPPAHQKDVEFNFDDFVEIPRGDSRVEMPYTTRAPSPGLHAFQPTLEYNVSDLAVASRSPTPLQSTTAAIPGSLALPKLPGLEIAGFKTLRTLSVTGSSSLIHEILSRIASLDLDAVNLVIHLSQPKISAPKPSRPRTPKPTSDELRGTLRGGEKKKKKGKLCSEPPHPVPDEEPLRADALVRSDPPSIKDTAPITDDRLLALTSRIASQWANYIRVVDIKPLRSTSFSFSGPTNPIFSLTPCEVLEVLDFRGWSFGPSLNNTISDLAQSWPKLTSLYFSPDYITIPTLRNLALSCPLLNILETNISLDDIPPIDPTKGYTLSHPLKVLSAGDNGTAIQSSRVLLLVARHLNILFPHVKVTTHESCNAEQWLQIGEFVEVFQAVRKDDADRGA
ncbi:hypothetical protein K443DRAFT_10513 [Laccaria amethystina LaAM-08-1]|uniref:Unplaced genomic scaffold K443scaffold_181, whole genome shotgun sequence n=1 Tax=Laccaria amethystina LaAM-08-1 TaxID=1095629 RepID=A0A0C9X5P1_9AGAR|nr:hypothetical protein K443DRAFT_10513 [Laccaria amethystina LaAM-08-1]